MNFDSPASHGFRMPPEWSRQEAIWLSWPHNPATWPGRMEQILQIFARFAAVISLYEKVCIIRGNARRETIQELLCDAGADISNVELFDFRTNDVWCRDHGPVFLRKDATGERAVADFSYNSWGGKFPPWNFDNDVPSRIAEALHLRRFPIPVVCEGGALEINGLGDLLTTESVVLNTNRNPGISRQEMTRILQEALGAETVFYLKRGMVGDDTDGHIDTLARFAADDVILAAVDDSPEGINKTVLDANFQDLERFRNGKGRQCTIIPIPCPAPIHPENWREEVLPATYVNYLLVNGAVLVPTYRDDRRDALACERIGAAFPNRKMETIDCFDIILEGGALHCLSQQMPL